MTKLEKMKSEMLKNYKKVNFLTDRDLGKKAAIVFDGEIMKGIMVRENDNYFLLTNNVYAEHGCRPKTDILMNGYSYSWLVQVNTGKTNKKTFFCDEIYVLGNVKTEDKEKVKKLTASEIRDLVDAYEATQNGIDDSHLKVRNLVSHLDKLTSLYKGAIKDVESSIEEAEKDLESIKSHLRSNGIEL